MNASAIYSKSGKGVQEASGKTNTLARSDRAVLSAIDGRATLADVAQKVGKSFDAATGTITDSYLRWVIYTPYATPESTGLTTKSGTEPWLMYPGTAGAHIMISPPKK